MSKHTVEEEKKIDELRKQFYPEPKYDPQKSGWTEAEKHIAAQNRDAMLRDPAPVEDHRVFLHGSDAKHRQYLVDLATRNERLAGESQRALRDLLHAENPEEEAKLQAATVDWRGEFRETDVPLLIYTKAVPTAEISKLQAEVAKIVAADAKRRKSNFVPRGVLQLIVCQNPAGSGYEHANNGFCTNGEGEFFGRVDSNRSLIRQTSETEEEWLYDGEQLVALICPGNFYVDRTNYRAIDLLERRMIALHDEAWKKHRAARDNR
jgi:hypothetical protein